MRKFSVAVYAVSLIAVVAFAADEPKPSMTKEQQAQMEAAMKAATPGDAHRKLDVMIGSWDAKITMYAPGQAPSVSSGTSENRWILGGRWIEQKVTSSFMGMPYEGIGYTGYDNIRKQYVGTWMDNFSTSVMTATGGFDASGKVFTFNATEDDPMTGKPMQMTEKMNVVDADHANWEMWAPGPDGRMMKMMEIAYSRRK